MMITTKLSLDFQKPGFPPVIHAVQGDKNSRCLEASLYCAGEPWAVPEGTIISLRYRKSDGKTGYYDAMPDGASAATVEGNVVSVCLAPQMLTWPGMVSAQLELLQEEMVLATFAFTIHVEADASDGVKASESYFNWLRWVENELDRRLVEARDSGYFTTIFYPSMAEDGTLTWSNNGNLENPAPMNLRGPAPERGVDYWTREDQTGIVQEVLAQLPAWTGGSY